MQLIDMPDEVQRQFYYAAQKGDWTPQEAFEHLVPEILRDNPEQVITFMNGGAVQTEVWTYDRGIGSGHYELVEIQDKDISRIISGKNGGEYSVENTVMEDMSINRSRGATNMTSEEYQVALDTNTQDATIIENSIIEESSMFEESQVIAPIAEETVMEAAMGALWEGILPAAAAVTAGAYVGDKFETKEDRLGYGALAAGGGALLAMTPIGQAAMLGFAGYKIFQAGKKVYNGLQTVPVRAVD